VPADGAEHLRDSLFCEARQITGDRRETSFHAATPAPQGKNSMVGAMCPCFVGPLFENAIEGIITSERPWGWDAYVYFRRNHIPRVKWQTLFASTFGKFGTCESHTRPLEMRTPEAPPGSSLPVRQDVGRGILGKIREDMDSQKKTPHIEHLYISYIRCSNMFKVHIEIQKSVIMVLLI